MYSEQMNSSRAWWLSVSFLMMAVSTVLSATKKAPADLFKQFIESPLPCEIVFEERLLTVTNWVLGRWQTNAYFCNKATNYDQAVLFEPNERKDGAGRFEKEYWRVSYNDRVVIKWVDQGDPTDTNNAAHLKLRSAQPLKQALNFGVPHSDFAAIRWNNDSFTFTNWAIGRGADMIITGKLNRDTLDRAGSLDVQLKSFYHENDGTLVVYRTYDWQIVYYYENNMGKSFLPSRYVTYVTSEERPKRRAFEVKILEMEFFPKPRDAKFFRPDPLMPNWDAVDLPQGFQKSKVGLATRKALLGTELGARLFPIPGSRGGTIIRQGTNAVIVDRVTGQTNPFPSVITTTTNANKALSGSSERK